MTDLIETRLCDVPFSATCCSWNIAGAPFIGITSLSYEEKIERKLVHPSKRDGLPLGITEGRYSVSSLSITMLRSSFQRLVEILTVLGGGTYGKAEFTIVATYGDLFASLQGVPPITVSIFGCRITGVKDTFQEGIDELVTEVELMAIAVTRNGHQLWSSSLLPSLDDIAPNQDKIILAGYPSPGYAVVKGAQSPRKWDLRTGYGLSGSTALFIGRDVSKFSVDIFLWKPQHFIEWAVFAQVLTAPPFLSLGIQHPTLNAAPISISQVQIENVTQLEQEPDGGGLWCSTINFFDFKLRAPALLKPQGGPPALSVEIKKPINPEEALIASNEATRAALAAQLAAGK